MIRRFVNWLKNKLRGNIPIEELIRCGMKVGQGCWFGEGVQFDWSFPWLIEIGNHVTLSHNVDLIAHDASGQKCFGATKIGKVIVGNNVFIGANTTLLPGSKIGDNSIIAAGSLVNKVIPPNEIWGGTSSKNIYIN